MYKILNKFKTINAAREFVKCNNIKTSSDIEYNKAAIKDAESSEKATSMYYVTIIDDKVTDLWREDSYPIQVTELVKIKLFEN